MRTMGYDKGLVLISVLCAMLPNYGAEDYSESNPFLDDSIQRYHKKQCPPMMSLVTPFTRDYSNHYEFCNIDVAESRYQRHPDQDIRTPEVISKYNYDLVTYDNVTTEDGYILTVFRITGGPKSPTKVGKPAVLLHHGLATASDNWLLQHGDRNLAFKLADAGYDVWLANARGTDYSTLHTTYRKDRNFAYWNFSFHEVGLYDLPAIVELMLTLTEQDNVFYIGHSMGSAVLAIALSERPELNDKVRAAFMLAPALYIGHSYNPMRSLTSIVGTPMQELVYFAMKGHFRGDRFLVDLLGFSPADLCTPTTLRCGVCDNALYFLYGYDAPQANYTNISNILSKVTNTASLKTVIHFAQNLISCQFRKYDYGIAGNLLRYRSLQPPAYNLKRITAPTFIFYGESDNFVPPVDVEMTRDAMLPETVKGFFKVKWPLFNHIDFVTARDADVLVYNQILEIMNSFK